MQKRQKLVIALTVGAALILLPLIFGLFPIGVSAEITADDSDPRDKYPVINPVVMDTVYAVDYVADIQAVQHVELRAMAGGFLEKIHVDEGEKVKKGQLLFSIASQGYEAEVLRATAALKSAIAEAKAAEVEVQNASTLVEKNVIAKTQLELVSSRLEALQAHVEEARSQEATAKLNLNYTKIRAPFDGTIGRIPNKAGSLLEEGAFITSISDHSQVYAYFNVSESEYLNLKELAKNDDRVSLILANNKPYAHTGRIGAIDSKIDRETGNIAFRASFSNPDQLLCHGATGKVRIRKEVSNALLIPQKVTFEVQDKTYVFVLNDENKVERRVIVPKLRLPNLYVIESGLSANDRMIFEGLQHVHEGDLVDFELVGFIDTSTEEQHVALL